MFNLHFRRDVDFTAVSPWTLATALFINLLLLLIALLFITTKRLFFHPLSKVPGPKIAAATRWYEFYYDCIVGGAYSRKLPGFHEKYASSIIRISPNHVHINDPDFQNEVFSPRSEFYKAPYFYDGIGVPGSIVTMTDPYVHKIRRNLLNPLFSVRATESISLRTTRRVEQALEIAVADAKAGKPINVAQLFRGIMFDNICVTAFGQSYSSVKDGEDETEFLANLDMFLTKIWIGKHFPIIFRVFLNLPHIIAKKIASGYLKFRTQSAECVASVIEKRDRGVSNNTFEQKYAFDLLLEPQPDKNYNVPSIEELVNEALILVIAGTDTTTYAAAHATYYVLTHSKVLQRLKEELNRTVRENGGRLDWESIRNLPYLAAIVQETLRLSPPIPGQLPRVVPPQGVQFQSHFLPGGTIVSVCAYVLHKDPRNFPEPENFNPDRWLGEEGKSLRKWNVAFSSGTRNCIGIHLAYQQLYLILALFFSKFEMELFETDANNLDWTDYGTARNKRPIQVKVKSVLT